MKYSFVVSCLIFIVLTIEIPSTTAHPPEPIIVVLALVNIAPFLGAVYRAEPEASLN